MHPKKYKIIDSYWYTPPFPGSDPVQTVMGNLPTLAIIFVAVDIGNGKWKCYMNWSPVSDDLKDTDAEQLVARNGAKVTIPVALAHFPKLSSEGVTY